jgi:hypothetical protein
VGTELTFALEPGSEETILMFTHADWREPVDFMHHCSTKWGYFLIGLKSGLEGSDSYVFPNDLRLSKNWG